MWPGLRGLDSLDGLGGLGGLVDAIGSEFKLTMAALSCPFSPESLRVTLSTSFPVNSLISMESETESRVNIVLIDFEQSSSSFGE